MGRAPQSHGEYSLTIDRGEKFTRIQPMLESSESDTFASDGEGQELALPQFEILRVLEGVAVALKIPAGQVDALQYWFTPRTANTEHKMSIKGSALVGDDKGQFLSVRGWFDLADVALQQNQCGGSECLQTFRIARLIIGLALLRQKSRLNQLTSSSDLEVAWGAIYDALVSSPLGVVARSAQGFLGIALCSIVEDGRIGELFRLHVWLPDGYRGNADFSIHSHQPWAQSWILAGESRDRSFHAEAATDDVLATHNTYALRWSVNGTQATDSADSEYKTHQTFSIVEKTDEAVSTTEVATALHTRDMSYTIPAATFHTTTVEPNDLHATLFFFDAYRGFVDHARVLGPCNGSSFVQARDPAGTQPMTLVRKVNALRSWEALMKQGVNNRQCSKNEEAVRAFEKALKLCESDADFPCPSLYKDRVLAEMRNKTAKETTG